jgi:NADPH:quinone reductase-like Zn-dependent oxidoreductase
MLAIVRTRYGPPESVRLEEVPTPAPGEGEVLVRVVASSVNRADLDYLTGYPAFARVVTGLRGPRIQRLGSDVAGVVEAVGPGVTRFAPGDEVIGDLTSFGSGAFAEVACAPERAFAPKPTRLSMEEAGALPWGGVLALQAVHAKRPLEPGHRVLVNGASGTVGSFAVQIAKHAGAEVTGVASTTKLDFVRGLGADHVIDYTREDVTGGRQRFDRIIDMAMHRSIFDVRRALRPGGVSVWVGGSMGSLAQTLVIGGVMTLAGSRDLSFWPGWRPFREEDVASLLELVEAGAVRPAIDRAYPLAEVAAALRYVDDGWAAGKVVITI